VQPCDLYVVVYILTLDFYVCRLPFHFNNIQSVVNNKVCKYHKSVFTTDLIFCNISKSNGTLMFLSKGAVALLMFGSAYRE